MESALAPNAILEVPSRLPNTIVVAALSIAAFPPNISFAPMLNPPTVPSSAVIFPENSASPFASNLITVVSVVICLFIIFKLPDESISNLDLSSPI